MDEKALYEMLWEKVIQPEFLQGSLNISGSITLREYRYPLSDHIGICAGVIFVEERFHELEYYYPYLNSRKISSESVCVLERYTFTENFAGILDETNLGITLIFFINNPLKFRELSLNGEIDGDTEFSGICLSAFANNGMVILPVDTKADSDETDYDNDDEEFLNEESRDALLDAALSGDEEALETLTESDILNYRRLSNRIETEDLYSVVEQSFMPCGVECDQYSIIGEITSVGEEVNSLSGEGVWLLGLSCNDVIFELCIRKKDLMGEPLKGRRVKCRLWMQGKVDPEKKVALDQSR